MQRFLGGPWLFVIINKFGCQPFNSLFGNIHRNTFLMLRNDFWSELRTFMFVCRSHLKIEPMQEVGDDDHVCTVCGQFFENASELRSHAESHVQETHRCAVCGLRFDDSAELSEHVLTNHRVVPKREPPSSCSLCGKVNITNFISSHFNYCFKFISDTIISINLNLMGFWIENVAIQYNNWNVSIRIRLQ